MERRLRGADSATGTSSASQPVASPAAGAVPMPWGLRAKCLDAEPDPDPIAIILKIREHRHSMSRHREQLQDLLVEASGFTSDMQRVQVELQETRMENEDMLRRVGAAICEG